MDKKQKGDGASRRDFLKMASVAAPAVATTALAGTAATAEIADEAAEGIQDTAHTRAFYHSARF